MGNEAAVAASIKKILEKDVKDSMMSTVAETVRDVQVRNINKTVYGRYVPKFYKRRFSDHGLTDRSNIRVNPRGKMGITMTNITRGNPRYGGDTRMRIAESIEFGTGVMAPIGARPFMKETYRDLRKNKGHVTALKWALHMKGYRILDRKLK